MIRGDVAGYALLRMMEAEGVACSHDKCQEALVVLEMNAVLVLPFELWRGETLIGCTVVRRADGVLFRCATCDKRWQLWACSPVEP